MFHAGRCWEHELVPFSLRPSSLPRVHPFTLPAKKKVGGPLAGRVFDIMIKKRRKKRAGKWVAEDRLRAALFGTIWLIPLSTALFGVANTYVGGTPGLVLCLFYYYLLTG